MKLFRTAGGPVIERDGSFRLLELDWDSVFRHADPPVMLRGAAGTVVEEPVPLAPVQSQEVWAAGVTYEVSRSARMEEAEAAAGGADVYDRVYDAVRPELFFKATSRTVVGQGDGVRIRHDAAWNVPEPELTLAVASSGAIFGFTIGNDMSSRDIEGENPLYLPQAKIYDGSCALGPAIVIGDPPSAATIELVIEREGTEVFRGATSSGRIRRPFTELVEFLFRDNTFPNGCLLMTGTGVVPDADFSLQPADVVSISIEGAGMLCNRVVRSDP